MKTEILEFLSRLTQVQQRMLNVLQRKQVLLVEPDKNALEHISKEEQDTVDAMLNILQQREELLTSVRLQNIDADSIETLCSKIFPNHFEGQKLLRTAKQNTQQIQLLAFTNWTMSRKALVHISQMLEIIETGGAGKTTYLKNGGTKSIRLVDRVA